MVIEGSQFIHMICLWKGINFPRIQGFQSFDDQRNNDLNTSRTNQSYLI